MLDKKSPLKLDIERVDVWSVSIISSPPHPEKGVLDATMMVQIRGMYYFGSKDGDKLDKEFNINVGLSTLDMSYQTLIKTLFSWAEESVKAQVGLKN